MSADVLSNYSEKMDKCIHFFEEEIATLRAGRANPAVLNKVMVDYYGVPTPISQIGSVSVPEPRTLMIQPWDATAVGLVEKAILKSDIGINPQNDGKAVRLNFPPLTEERRQDLVKTLHKKGEETKVHIRNIRRDAVEQAKLQKKNSEITEDDLKDLEQTIQKATDTKIKEVDAVLSKKEKDLMEV